MSTAIITNLKAGAMAAAAEAEQIGISIEGLPDGTSTVSGNASALRAYRRAIGLQAAADVLREEAQACRG